MKQTDRLMIRVSPEFKAELQKKADEKGMGLTENMKWATQLVMDGFVHTPAPLKDKVVHTSTKPVCTEKSKPSDSGYERFKRFKNTNSTLQDFKQLRPWANPH
jgi:hypothetical protein